MAINSLQAREVSDQMKILQPTMLDLTEGAILRDVGNLTGTVKMPKRILNVLGEINAHSAFANNPGRIKKLQSVARLAATIELLRRRKTAIAAAKVETADEELRGKGPAGLVKLQKNNTKDPAVAKLSIDEMRGVVLVYMHQRMKKASKAVVANAFSRHFAELRWELPAATPSQPTTATAAAAVTGVEFQPAGPAVMPGTIIMDNDDVPDHTVPTPPDQTEL